MHLAMFNADQADGDAILLDALRQCPNVEVTVLPKMGQCDCDYYCIVGVKQWKQKRMLEGLGKKYLSFDKGYNRDWPRWWRVSLNSHQATNYLMSLELPSDRAKKQGWLNYKPWKSDGEYILFAGASNKYHTYHNIENVTEYAERIIKNIQTLSKKPVIYRPKPSWKDAIPISGSHFSVKCDIWTDLARSSVMVTHGSGACLESIMEGVPAIVLGDGITRDISSNSIEDVDNPMLASDQYRTKLLSSLAYFQWSIDEIRRGDFIPVIQEIDKCI